MPSKATAVVNHRIHPSQSVQEILDYDKQLVNDDRIKFAVKGLTIEPHPISPYDDDTFGYQVIKKSLRETFPGIIVIPGIMIATTDTRFDLKLRTKIEFKNLFHYFLDGIYNLLLLFTAIHPRYCVKMRLTCSMDIMSAFLLTTLSKR